MTVKRRTRKGRVRKQAFALRWTARALDDLEAIGDYIARDNPLAAARWISELMAVAERAARMPLSGRRVPELARDDVREVFKRNYRIAYRVREDCIEVLTMFEGAQTLST